MKYIVCLFLVVTILSSCKNDQPPVNHEWKHKKTVLLDSIRPIGLVAHKGGFYISDGDHNRLVRVNPDGKITKIIDNLQRPMHIDYAQVTQQDISPYNTKDRDDNMLVVPEYGRDSISLIHYDTIKYVSLPDSLSLDAPAAVSVYKNELAIADFYNHRVVFYDGNSWKSLGSQGKKLGEFYYPTDVQITKEHIYIADAYNHRVQVFNKDGKAVRSIAENQNINAATGLYVNDEFVFITDFEHDRVLVYNHNDELLQVLDQDIHKATDMIIYNNRLYIVNYQKGELVTYEYQPTNVI